jgi:outer membrane biogenesis lipoprotein LolB
MLLLAIAMLALGACATTSDRPEGSSPADKLSKADADPEVHGDLQITLSRTH